MSVRFWTGATAEKKINTLQYFLDGFLLKIFFYLQLVVFK